MRKASGAGTTSTVVRDAAGRVTLRKALLVVMALSLLLALPAVPAAADHAQPPGDLEGEGALEGTETVQDEVFTGSLCFRVSRSIFLLRGEGIYSGRTAEGDKVVYEAATEPGGTLYGSGSLQVEVENTATYYSGPYGTHGTSDTSCAPATSNSPVPAEFRVFAAEGAEDTDGDGAVDLLTGEAWVYRVDDTGEKVPCTGQGSFARGGAGESPNWRAEWTLGEECVVVGNEAGIPGQGVAPVYTAHTHHGTHAPCFNPPCVDNLKVDYEQYFPVEGFHVGLSGPASARVNDLVTVTATVTDDGAAVPDAPVSFAVTDGPGPGLPPGGAGLTDVNGRAAFAFTAVLAGDYTVTATSSDAGEAFLATHTVAFTPAPPAAMTMEGPTRAQNDENVTVTAVFTDGGDPVPAARVDFAVDGPYQTTPASGSAFTGIDGRAAFTFVADRAGDYTVTASASHLGEDASATHVVRVEVNTFHRVDAITLPAGERDPGPAFVDPGGDYAYFSAGGNLVKVDLDTFQRVGSIPGGGQSAVIDPAGDFAYLGTGDLVRKVDLRTFQHVGVLTLESDERDLRTAVIDPAGEFAYFGTYDAVTGETGKVVKVDLDTFQRVGAITLEPGEGRLETAVMDPAGGYAYFGALGNQGKVVKIDLTTFERVGAVTLNGSAEAHIRAAVIDPAGDFAYFGTGQGRVVKVDLTTFRRVGALVLPAEEDSFRAGVIDPPGDFAYFAMRRHSDLSHSVVKVDLDAFERVGSVVLPDDERAVYSAVMDPAGDFAYFGVDPNGFPLDPPGKIVKVAVSRAPVPWLVAADDAYVTEYHTALSVPAPGVLANDTDTADGDALTAHVREGPERGEVALERDGSFTYTPHGGFSGTDTFTYVASDARDYTAPATVSIEVGAPTEDDAVGLAFNYYTDVSLFGGPSEVRGYGQPADAPAEAASPAVACPEGGGADSAADADGARAQYGPAAIFSGIWPEDNDTAPPSGPMTSAIDCQLGSGGHVSASTSVSRMPAGSTWTTPGGATEPHPGGVGPGPFIADEVHSSCTMTPDGTVTSDVSVVNGILETSYDPDTGEPTDTEAVPASPPVNDTREGTVDHVGDSYRVVFNEQTHNADGSLTVNAVHLYLLGPGAVGDMVIGSSTCGPLTVVDQPDTARAVADFDGDATTDLGVFRPSTGRWHIRGVEGLGSVGYGLQGDIPVPGDYDGDGTADVAVFRPDAGRWYVRGVEGLGSVNYGLDGDVPVPGDYDGDGTTDLAVFRPTTGRWYVRGVEGLASVGYGTSGDVPVPGDYDGDGTTDLAVFRPTTGRWYVRDVDGLGSVGYGVEGDVPVPGDYDGDGTTDLAVFRPSTGRWHVRGVADLGSVGHGMEGDIPVPGDYSGDGATDIAVFRPDAGRWYVRGVEGLGAVNYGMDGDIPVVMAPALHQTFFPPAPG